MDSISLADIEREERRAAPAAWNRRWPYTLEALAADLTSACGIYALLIEASHDNVEPRRPVTKVGQRFRH